MKYIYFDNSASTPLCGDALKALTEGAEVFANPSSLHRLGFEAETLLDRARRSVAKTFFCDKNEIVFTSGGTESDNTAVYQAFALSKRFKEKGGRVITTDSEHPAVSEPLKRLELSGLEIVRLSTKGGRLDEDEIRRAADDRVVLASIMHTNNETGAIYDVKSAFSIIRKASPSAVLHTDAVQGYLKSSIRPAAIGADLVSVSAHKVHAPKGVGALYVRNGFRLTPFLPGGGQERGLRSGTENLPGILAFAAAASDGFDKLAEYTENIRAVRRRLIEGLSSYDFVRFNVPESEKDDEEKYASGSGTSSPAIISIQVMGEKSEVLLHKLSDRGICVSSGSACSSKKGKSGVLKAFGLSDAEADRTIRISLSHMNTVDEAEIFCRTLRDAVGK